MTQNKSVTGKIKTACGTMFATILLDEVGLPTEVLFSAGKAGGCAKAHLSCLAICITGLMKHHDRLGGRQYLYLQLEGFKCHQSVGGDLNCINQMVRFVHDYEKNIDAKLKSLEEEDDDN